MRRELTRQPVGTRVRGARSVARIALAGVLGWSACTDARAQAGALFAVPTELESPQALPPNSPWHIALHATDVSVLARALNVAPPPAEAHALDYTLDRYPEISGSPARTWRESTFVIDYQEREVAELYAGFLKAQAGRAWSRQSLVDFVAASMTPSVGHPFEVASQVARTRNGDCKGYAVLTAALARSAGVPARVAFGFVLLEHDGHYATFGHAWAESREAEHWVVADAAMRKYPGVARYLPLGVLNDEGPGFEMSVMRLTPAWVERVTIRGAP